MSRQTETLARIPLFRSLDAGAIRHLDTQCAWRRAPANQWIVDYQDASNDVFFVVSGTVRVKIQSVSGREVLLREIKAGEFFGELAAIEGKKTERERKLAELTAKETKAKSNFEESVKRNDEVRQDALHEAGADALAAPRRPHCDQRDLSRRSEIRPGQREPDDLAGRSVAAIETVAVVDCDPSPVLVEVSADGMTVVGTKVGR